MPDQKQGGRPRGQTTKQKLVQSLIARGVPPLQAFQQAGFAQPYREMKRQVHVTAAALHVDPRAKLRHVIEHGSTADRVAACSALLSFPSTASVQSGTNCLFLFPPMTDAEERAAVEHFCEQPSAGEAPDADHAFARAHLESIIADARTKDAALVSACRALLRDNPEPQKAEGPEPTLYIFEDNGRALPDDEDDDSGTHFDD